MPRGISKRQLEHLVYIDPGVGVSNSLAHSILDFAFSLMILTKHKFFVGLTDCLATIQTNN